MFASADQRADVKHGMKNLAVGSVLVFATTPVIRFVTISVSRLIDPSLPTDEYGNSAENYEVYATDGSAPDRVLMGNLIAGEKIIYDGYVYVYNCRTTYSVDWLEINGNEADSSGSLTDLVSPKTLGMFDSTSKSIGIVLIRNK